jgi:hypothetical protein
MLINQQIGEIMSISNITISHSLTKRDQSTRTCESSLVGRYQTGPQIVSYSTS